MSKQGAKNAMTKWVGTVADNKAKADQRGGDPVIDQDLADVQNLSRALDAHVAGGLTARIAARVPGLRT